MSTYNFQVPIKKAGGEGKILKAVEEGKIPLSVYITLSQHTANYQIFISADRDRILEFKKSKKPLVDFGVEFRPNYIPAYHIDKDGKVEVEWDKDGRIIYYIEKFKRSLVDASLSVDEMYELVGNRKGSVEDIVNKYKDVYRRAKDADLMMLWSIPDDETGTIRSCVPLEIKPKQPRPVIYCAFYYNLTKLEPDKPLPIRKFCNKITDNEDEKQLKYEYRNGMKLISRVYAKSFKCRNDCRNLAKIEDLRTRNIPPGTIFGVACAYCGRPIFSNDPRQKYCKDRNCRKLASRRRRNLDELKNKKCLKCGGPLLLSDIEDNGTVWISNKESAGGINIKCDDIKTELKPKRYSKFCMNCREAIKRKNI